MEKTHCDLDLNQIVPNVFHLWSMYAFTFVMYDVSHSLFDTSLHF